MASGVFYRHFGDKEALFGALAEPVVTAVFGIYSEFVKRHFEKARTDELKQKWSGGRRMIGEPLLGFNPYFPR